MTAVGTRYTVRVNGTVVWTGVEAHGSQNTRVGVYAANSATVDNFLVTGPV